MIEEITSKRKVEDILDVLNEVGVPCAPINTIDKVIDHPQLAARDMIVQVQGEKTQAFKTAGNPIKMSGFEEIDTSTPLRAPA